MKNYLTLLASLLLATGLAACSQQAAEEAVSSAPEESAEAFITRVNDELKVLRTDQGAAGWVRATYITEDTAILSAAASERYAEWHSRAVAGAAKVSVSNLCLSLKARPLRLILIYTVKPTRFSQHLIRKLLIRGKILLFLAVFGLLLSLRAFFRYI